MCKSKKSETTSKIIYHRDTEAKRKNDKNGMDMGSFVV
jgi:hypothetical protein